MLVNFFIFLHRPQPAFAYRGAGELEPIPFSAYRHDVFIAMEPRKFFYQFIHYLHHYQKVGVIVNERTVCLAKPVAGYREKIAL